MLLGMEQIETSLRVAVAVAPVAMYFLLLGLLNTRRHPQMLTGRQDSALLALAMSPLLVAPVVHWLGGGLHTALGCAAALMAGVLLLSPRGQTWVIYNLPLSETRRLVETVLRGMGVSTASTRSGLRLDTGGEVELSHFPVLRNVTLRLSGGDKALWRELEARLAARLQLLECEPSPMAVTLLLVATAMIVAPLAMVVHHGPEIVRLLTDLLP